VAGPIGVMPFEWLTHYYYPGRRPGRLVDADAAVIDAIRQDPAGYYVNVPTPATGGAIRGRPQASPQRKHQQGDRTVSDQERDGCNAGVPWSV
jgi:hypothetical protein